jgi:signal transduction histidine kinase
LYPVKRLPRLSRVPPTALHAGGLIALIVVAIAPLAHLAWRTSERQAELEVTLLRSEALMWAQRFGARASAELYNGANAVLRPLNAGRFADPSRAPSDPRLMFDAAREAERCRCAPPFRPLYAFRTNLTAAGTVVVGGPRDTEHTRWLVDAVRRVRTRVRGNWDVAVMSELDQRTGTVVFLSSNRRSASDSVLIFGFATDTALVSRYVFRDAFARLNPPLAAPQDWIALRVVDERGLPVFATRAAVDTAYSHALVLGDIWGQWSIEASLLPYAAAHVLGGQRPRSATSYLWFLLGVAALLLAGATMLVWRMVDLARVRNDFTSSVSHELRTPLTQILLYSEMLEMERAGGAGERRAAVGVITRETRRLIHLVENVLRYSRAEKHGEALNVRPLGARTVLDQVAADFVPLADTKRVAVGVVGDEAIVVEADEDALRRIAINLLDNAVKHGPAGQTVTLGVEKLDDWIRVFVDDDGPGVPAEHRQRIFQPYARLSGSAIGSDTGSGLGLANVRSLAQAHRGRYGVIERAGGGSRFFVDFRWRRAPG